MFEKPRRKVSRVFVHCSASDRLEHDNVDIIREWHLARGFDDIGYHYFIDKTGELHAGRNIEQRPAAQKGHNKDTIAICVSGLEHFNARQMLALLELCVQIDVAYDGTVTFHGHREVNKTKTCPVFDYRTVLRLDDDGRM